MRRGFLVAVVLIAAGLCGTTAMAAPPTIAPARWLRPDAANARPVWGIAGGIAVGLADGPRPKDGPRGLLRVYTPYLGQPAGLIMNFVAVEPVVRGERGLSEMEKSRADDAPGKRIVAVDRIDLAHVPDATTGVAAGVIGHDGDVETLSVDLAVERFENGARPVVRLTFRADRPHEVTLQTFAAADSAPMDACVLTATMGNYARLRRLQLADGTIDAAGVFAGDKLGYWDFYPWHEWPADRLTRRGDAVTASAVGEPDAAPPPSDWRGWRYIGRAAVQTWSSAVRPGLVARVNGRTTFWGTHVPIPGGVAFENFELKAPFEAGEAFTFAIEPR